MRAILTGRTTLSDTQLEELLKEHHWWPGVDQGGNLAVAHANEILEQVHGSDSELIENTLLFKIYHEESRTWGIINRPSSGMITVRLKNPTSDRLKNAAEKFIMNLTQETPKYERDGKPLVKFNNRIEILEASSDRTAFLGEIIESKQVSRAIKERRRETSAGILMLAVALLLMLLTTPVVVAGWHYEPASPWEAWGIGNLSRLATATLAAALIAWTEVFFHWRDIRREAPVRWVFEHSAHAK